MARWIAIAAALGAAGCTEDPTPVGAWQASIVVVEQRGSLDVAEDGSGSAVLYIVYMASGENQAGRFDFDVRWEAGKDFGVYEFEMRCRTTPFGDCEEGDDFDMTCGIDEEGTILNCEGDANWRDYAFEWVRG